MKKTVALVLCMVMMILVTACGNNTNCSFKSGQYSYLKSPDYDFGFSVSHLTTTNEISLKVKNNELTFTAFGDEGTATLGESFDNQGGTKTYYVNWKTVPAFVTAYETTTGDKLTTAFCPDEGGRLYFTSNNCVLVFSK